MNSTQAVFLHSGYGATDGWLWSCLRDLDGVIAYDEPLRAMVASVDYEQYASTGSDGAAAAMRASGARPTVSVSDSLRRDALGMSIMSPVVEELLLSGSIPEVGSPQVLETALVERVALEIEE